MLRSRDMDAGQIVGISRFESEYCEYPTFCPNHNQRSLYTFFCETGLIIITLHRFLGMPDTQTRTVSDKIPLKSKRQPKYAWNETGQRRFLSE